MWKRKTLIISTLFILISYGCSSNKDPVSEENRNIEPNATERTKRFAEKGGGIFGGELYKSFFVMEPEPKINNFGSATLVIFLYFYFW